ncbi:hypothetical protein K4K58_010703 [Colletotrichum sp. SAR11_239]|nr:hypothetical protein K4K58_010703 [Colletotrichum sp. SAR11_239]
MDEPGSCSDFTQELITTSATSQPGLTSMLELPYPSFFNLTDDTQDRKLIHHFCTVLSHLIVFTEEPDNSFQELILPLASENSPVLHAMCAFSKGHLEYMGVQDSKHSSNFRVLAAEGVFSLVQQNCRYEEVLAATMLLVYYESLTLTGSSNMVLEHLRSAFVVLSSMPKSAKSQSVKFLEKAFQFYDVIAALSLAASPVSATPDSDHEYPLGLPSPKLTRTTFGDPLLGMTGDLWPILYRLSSLKALKGDLESAVTADQQSKVSVLRTEYEATSRAIENALQEWRTLGIDNGDHVIPSRQPDVLALTYMDGNSFIKFNTCSDRVQEPGQLANRNMTDPATEYHPWVSEIQLEVPQLGPKLEPCAHKTSNNQKGNISTNVARLSAAVAHKCCTGMPQIVFYHRGAGTEESKVAQALGGVLGEGIIQDVADVYRFICDNYNPGDELVIVGFSRGAFTARSVSGMVCNIGLLNRVGLANFGDIFHDYQNFPNWRPGTKFNIEDHLAGFTLTNYERLERFRTRDNRKDHATLQKELDEDKQKFFDRITKCKKQDVDGMDLITMAQKYRDFLEKHEMILCEKTLQERDGKTALYFAPVVVTIQAVGVWDTVGSLGWPKMPWEKIRTDRSADELRFASLDVHPNVEHAFHALALDEWRTAFSPTLWGKRGNTTTHLRQVWFPGSHSNVGGGFKDQQIATIALAWMADQLTSVGVEFSTPEMKRIFYTVDPSVEAREWGKGRISNPSGTTAIPDKAYNAFWYPWQTITGGNTVAGTRTPGSYMEDGRKDVIQDPNELIHPSVRIRYLYDGLGLDDNGDWECSALTKNGYKLQKSSVPLQVEDPYHKDFIASTYETLSGTVASVHGGMPIDPNTDHKLVLHQLPFEYDLYQLEEAKNNWVWEKEGKILPEERIGMWERLFIKVNHNLLYRQKETQRLKEEREAAEPKSNDWFSGIQSWAGDKVNTARSAAGSALTNTVGRLLPSSGKLKPADYHPDFGYHDFVSWQKGDATKTTRKIRT